MVTRFIAGCKYTHEKSMDVYFFVDVVNEYDDYFTLGVIWKKKSNNSILIKEIQKVSILKSSLREWLVYQYG